MRYRMSESPEREASSGIPVALIVVLIAGLSAYLVIGDLLTETRQQTRVYPPEAVTLAESGRKAP
ncbi:hypothetical protein ABIE78_002987 [Sinorhizobium fredii]|uniref:Transmembrane protein n=2 Tax=Rhizobium fredii TaxID=380 RepID=I3X5P6_SINF2|nr:hypothetical protein [Sinorhizobium fredii]AFL51202.1 hypothetical protein USDA257_c26280 [Sinorhizobium fredii USDA 257]